MTHSKSRCGGCGYHTHFRLSSTPLRSSSSLSPAVFITKLSSERATPPPLSSSFLEKGSSPLLSPIKSNNGIQLSPILTDERNGSGLSSAPPISSPPLSPILSTTATCTSGIDTAAARVGVAIDELNGSYTCSTTDEGNVESSPVMQHKLSMYYDVL